MFSCWVCKESYEGRRALRRHELEGHLSHCSRCGGRHSGKFRPSRSASTLAREVKEAGQCGSGIEAPGPRKCSVITNLWSPRVHGRRGHPQLLSRHYRPPPARPRAAEPRPSCGPGRLRWAPRSPGRQHPPLTRVYQTSWHLFCEWTLLTGRQSMPAEPQTVAICLGHLAMEDDPSPDDGQLHGEAHRGLNPQGPSPTTPSTPPATLRAMTPRTKRGSNID